MSGYQKLASIGAKFFGLATLFRVGFNLSPMYRRTTARITHVSEDLHEVRIKLPISYRNRNYVGTIYGGSMFSSVDGIPMVQLINILGSQYVVWDKSARVFFRRPAREDLFASLAWTGSEIEAIKAEVDQAGEMDFVKSTALTDAGGDTVFFEVQKTIYIATKAHHREKQRKRNAGKAQ